MNRAAIIVLAIALSILAGCDESYDDQLSRLKSYVAERKVGNSSDVWLEQASGLQPGQWDEIALIFGFADDYAACVDFKNAYTNTHPLIELRCVPAQ